MSESQDLYNEIKKIRSTLEDLLKLLQQWKLGVK